MNTYILFLVILLGNRESPLPLVLKSPVQYNTQKECIEEGQKFTVQTSIPVAAAMVRCEMSKIVSGSENDTAIR